MQFESEALPLTNSAWSADWASESSRLMPVSQTLSAVSADRRLGSLLVQQLPDDTVALSNLSTELQLPDDEQHDVRTSLLQQSVWVSKAVSPRYVRYLVSEREAAVIRALSDAGFTCAGQVEEWTKAEHSVTAEFHLPVGSVCCRVEAVDVAAHSSLDFTSLLSEGGDDLSLPHISIPRAVLCGLLDDCLQHSNDLPMLPLPEAEQLLRLWRLSRSQVRIFLAVHEEQPAGLMLTSLVDDGRVAGTSDVVIEYIGVGFNARRKGIAAGMLSLLCSDVCGRHQSPKLTAFAGADNEAAACLYRRGGFAPGGRLWVWIAS
ncbi:MAG: GNAT family N-acetyltransferase [Fuerstiella sp.]|nr:GNAT family N-acetyltransferase [Fuerstiella sp.]